MSVLHVDQSGSTGVVVLKNHFIGGGCACGYFHGKQHTNLQIPNNDCFFFPFPKIYSDMTNTQHHKEYFFAE